MLTFLKCACCCFYCCCMNQVLPRFSEPNSRKTLIQLVKMSSGQVFRLQKVPCRFRSHRLSTVHLLDHVSGFPCHQLQKPGRSVDVRPRHSGVGAVGWWHECWGESAFSALLIVRAFFCLSEHVEPRGHNAKGRLRLGRGLTLEQRTYFSKQK